MLVDNLVDLPDQPVGLVLRIGVAQRLGDRRQQLLGELVDRLVGKWLLVRLNLMKHGCVAVASFIRLQAP